MIIQQTYQAFQNKRKLHLVVTVCIALLILANTVLDFSSASFQNSSYYISESLLFSTYWVLYFPLLCLFSKRVNRTEKIELKIVLSVVAIATHTLAYPALVWMLSKLFYAHTFAYWQTFAFGLSAYFIKTVIVYGFLFMTFSAFSKANHSPQAAIDDVKEKAEQKHFISSILVSDTNNKQLVLQVNDILYFSANSPYISIHHLTKKYLHTDTLKSLQCQLDEQQFVRIHKSYIVNTAKISAIQSRQNGDYDALLSDNTILRVSRSYAKNFKSKFLEQHHLSTK